MVLLEEEAVQLVSLILNVNGAEEGVCWQKMTMMSVSVLATMYMYVYVMLVRVVVLPQYPCDVHVLVCVQGRS